jgi:8-oxo-dGTP pyrophosphatase MutT (NUDIX family)
VPPADLAGTVVLLRDDPVAGLQVLLQRRLTTLTFAPGMDVFPGGRVDPADRKTIPKWRGPTPAEWAAVLNLPSASDATGVLRAAVRETHEECGVRLQKADELDTSVLHPWSIWVTPEWAPRRYATFFLAAALPPGEVARTASGESTSTRWVSPREVVGPGAPMMLPTRATLRELAAHDTVADALAHPPQPGYRQIRAEVAAGQVRLLLDTPRGTVTKDQYLAAVC